MAYLIKNNCERVVLHVLAGADPSIVGLSIKNCNVISMTFHEFYDLTVKTRGIAESNHLIASLFEHQIGTCDDTIIILEVVERPGQQQVFEDDLLNALRLYKAEDIYSVYFMSYRFKDGKLTGGGRGRMVKYKHGIDYFPARFHLTPEEKDAFGSWFTEYQPKLRPNDHNDNYKNVLHAYNTSFLIGVAELEYIMLFSVLEMIFGSGHSEITYQISRGTALLLSSKSEEMNSIYKK